jgi:hypothetical protein
MTVRSSLLLGGVVLLAAIPVCADSIFYAASTNEPSNPESSAPAIRTSHARFLGAATDKSISEPLPESTPFGTFALPEAAIAQDSLQTEIAGNHTRTFALAVADPQNDERPSGPAPALLSVNGFQPGGAFASSGPETSLVLDTLIPAASKPSFHSGNSAEFNSSEPAFSDLSTEGSRFGFFGNDPDQGKGGKGKNKKKDQDGPPVNVPEPGALPLLTLGVLAVGIIAARNRDLTANA